ncbi:autotransporter outer membrane beta-barrel domain-containing protein, partial [Pseudomonas aeruginosa]|nr:autotransporter outer membrane beta-barrel domain-containing protein [Pseudomonas aeruginosa]
CRPAPRRFELQGKYAFGSDTQLFAEYAHEREYEDDTQDLTMSLNSLPGNRFTLEGYTPQDHLNRVSLGFSQKLAPELSLRGGYNWRKGEDDTQQSVSLALSLDF